MKKLLGRHTPNPLAVGVAILLTTTTIASSNDAAAARVKLQTTGVDQDAEGFVLATLGSKKSIVQVQVSRLEPRQSYHLKVGELTEAEFTTDSKGRGRLRFLTPAQKGRQLLDFDPRGKTVSVLNSSEESVLEAVVSGENEPADSIVTERAALTRQNGERGNAKASYQARKNGRRSFRVEISKISGQDWQLYVNGIPRGEITVRGKSGEASFDSTSSGKQRLLDFDPRGAVIDIFQGETLKFSGKVEAKAKGVNFATRRTLSDPIPDSGAGDFPEGATAEAKLRTNADASRDFEVELKDIPEGTYTLFVNNAPKGSIVVRSTAAGLRGKIEFSTDPDDSDELLLDFDPIGAALAVWDESGVAFKFFKGVFNPSSTNSGGNLQELPTELEESLASTGLDADASGEAKYEVRDGGEKKFSIEIEDVAAGTYDLFIGGVLRASIKARLEDGQVQGELEFSAGGDDARKQPLRFDPRGQLIEVKSSSGVLFSHVFGDGSATEGAAVPLEIEVPLLNAGVAPVASVRAEFKRDEDGDRSFEVDAEGLPAGAYELFIDGTARGTINVIAVDSGTRGQLEFETDGDDGILPLTFDVLGKDITVQAGGTVYFSRTFPTGN